MGFPFHPTGGVKRAEDENHTVSIKGAPRCAAKTKEKSAGVNPRGSEETPGT
jgi:hypothetical protein